MSTFAPGSKENTLIPAIPIFPATTRNPYTKLYGFVEVAGLTTGQSFVTLFKYDYRAPSDLNNVLSFSMGSLPQNTTNAPSTNYLYFICLKASYSEQYLQVCFDYWKQTNMYVRTYNNGSWANWVKYAGVELA